MARPLRVDYPGAIHHATNRGLRHQDIFRTEEDRAALYRLIGLASERHNIVIHSYAFMDNHLHLIVESVEGNLSAAMHLIESAYVQGFNRRNGLDGPLFKGRFYSRPIDVDNYLRNAIVYVMQNPLAASIVSDAADFEWSSYNDFLRPAITRPPWLSDRGLVMSGITTKEQLRAAVHSGPIPCLDLQKYPHAIGSADFIAATLDQATLDHQTIAQLRRALPRPTATEIETAVASVMNVDPASLLISKRGPMPSGTPRAISMFLLQELGAVSLRELASRYNYASAESAGNAVSRFRRRYEQDDLLALRVEQVRQLVLGGTGDRSRIAN